MDKNNFTFINCENKAQTAVKGNADASPAAAAPAPGAQPPQQAEERATAVDLNGLMTVLGRHLYSTPMVAVRELVQNAHDSIIRRRIEDKSWNEASSPPRITVAGDLARGVIRIIDTGAGLTAREVHAYLATVGVGYTRTLRAQDDSSGLIGMFGLGFLSAFVLASDVTVTTTSYQTPGEGWQYQSSTGESYSLTPVEPRPIGTEVRLTLRGEFDYLAGPDMLRRILGKYCVLLREPVYINDDKTALNPEEPPWRVKGGNAADNPALLLKRRMEFASRFDQHFEPLCVIPVFPPEGGGEYAADAVGLLWVQDSATYGTSDNRQLSVFGRGMLLDDDARDLLPHWAGFVSGVIESNLLTPTASREDLQKDDIYYATQRAISEALITGLGHVAQTQPEAWRRVLWRHNSALLGASLCDDRLFDLLADSVRVPNSQGDLPAAALRTASGAVHVRLGSHGGFEDMLFRVLKTPVARGDLYAVVPFLRKWVELRGGTLVELGTKQGNSRLFSAKKMVREEEDWLAAALCGGDEHLVPSRFLPEELPMVVVHDREAELKRLLEKDEADRRISSAALRLARNYTKDIDTSAPTKLYVNLDNPAVKELLAAHRAGRDTAALAGILKALKVIMAAGGEKDERLDVNSALNDFCNIAAALVR